MSAMTIPWIESGVLDRSGAPRGLRGLLQEQRVPTGAVARLARLVREEQVLLGGRGDHPQGVR